MITTNKIPQGQLNTEVSQTITNGVTDKAPSEDAVFDALALKSPLFLWEYYSDGSQINPADNSVYYSAYLNNAVATTSNAVRFLSTKTNTKFSISMNIMCPNTLGSNETSTIKLLNITAGTEETIGTITHDKRLNILGGVTTLANAINDELVVQVNNPTWATNPTNVWYNWTVKAY
jgi:hypothetical protein